MSLEHKLLNTPVDQWVVRQAVIFDWYDGPREGVCSLASPPGEFYFELLAERPTEDDLDDRLFLIRELPTGAVASLVKDLRELGEPATPVWAPTWRFTTEPARQRAEQTARQLETAARPVSLVVSTRDMKQFRDCWRAAPPQRGDLPWPSLSATVPPAATP